MPAVMIPRRLGVPREQLRRAMWGDIYFNPKTKRFSTDAAAAALSKGKPLAVSLMLDRLWALYEATVTAVSACVSTACLKKRSFVLTRMFCAMLTRSFRNNSLNALFFVARRHSACQNSVDPGLGGCSSEEGPYCKGRKGAATGVFDDM